LTHKGSDQTPLGQLGASKSHSHIMVKKHVQQSACWYLTIFFPKVHGCCTSVKRNTYSERQILWHHELKDTVKSALESSSLSCSCNGSNTQQFKITASASPGPFIEYSLIKTHDIRQGQNAKESINFDIQSMSYHTSCVCISSPIFMISD
jgi:hypothetical protein